VVFKSLPIKYDAYGRARFNDSMAEAPLEVVNEVSANRARDREQTMDSVVEQPGNWNFTIDPLTRASSGLVLNSLIDFGQRRVLDAYVENTQFCGFELTLKERNPSDATQIACRTSGRASGAHAIAATMALEMTGNRDADVYPEQASQRPVPQFRLAEEIEQLFLLVCVVTPSPHFEHYLAAQEHAMNLLCR
jgi:hypothetical protein